MNNTNEKIKNGFKNYLKAQQLFNKNRNESLKYFQKTLDIFSKCEKSKKYQKYQKIIEETEIECNRQLILSINDSPKILNNKNNIFKLIAKGKINEIKKLKYNEINLVNNFNHEGLSPLHYAIKMGDMNILKELLKIGGKIDQVNENGYTLLEYACLEKDPNSIIFFNI